MSTITASQVKDLRELTGLGMMQCKKALSETGGDVEKAVELLRKQGAAVAAKRSGREAKEGKIFLSQKDNDIVAVELNCETDFVAANDDFNMFGNLLVKAILENKPADLEAMKTSQYEGKSIADINTEVIAKTGENIAIRRFVHEKTGPNEFAETYSHMGGKIGVIVKIAADNAITDSAAIGELARDLAMQVAATNPLALDPEGIPADVLEKEKEIYKEQAIAEGKPAEFADKIIQGRISKFYKENCLNQQIFVKDSKLTIQKLLEKVGKEQKLNNLVISSYHRLQLGE